MKDKQIYLKGSSCFKESREVTDGECFRVVNLRKHNNSLCPIGNFTTVAALAEPGRTLIYSHECNQTQHLISTDGQSVFHELDISDSSFSIINKTLITLDEKPTQVNSLGYTLIISTPSSTYYLLFNNSEYKILGEKPPMPTIRFFTRNANVYGSYLPFISFNEHITSLSEEQKRTISEAIMGNYYATRNAIYKDNAFMQPVLVRYALRLYDGSHILSSPPILVGQQYYNQFSDDYQLYFSFDTTNETTDMLDFFNSFVGYQIEYIIDNIALDDWKDIVTGIDFFVSKEIDVITDEDVEFFSHIEVDKYYFTYKFNYPTVNLDEVSNTALNETIFYKLATNNNLNTPTGTSQLLSHNIRPDNIIYEEILTADTSNFYKIGAQHSYIYNNRLHLADIARQYYVGYPAALFSNSLNTDNSNAPAYIRTNIKTNNQGSIEVISIGTIPHFNYTLSPIISYPSAYASSMEIVIRHNGYEYRKTFTLSPIDNEDRASFINKDIKDIDVTLWEKREITDEILGDFPSAPVTKTRYFHNQMIVSELNNPFFFPSPLTYNISNGTIAAITAATSALSQGQYGEFPLYVFTTQGIWSLQYGNNEVCYARCVPINNRNINPSATVTPIDNAIIYRTEDELAIISGANNSTLLPLKELTPHNFNTLIEKFIPAASQATADNTPLIDYFNGSLAVGYLPNNNEMIFCNNKYPYCIVIHITDGHIFRIDKNFKSLINSGNRLLAQSDNDIIYDLSREIPATTDICLISHPIQPARETYTHLRQVAMRMRADYALLNIMVLAAYEPDGYYCTIFSADGEGYIESDFISHISAPAFKYYRIIIYGSTGHDMQINRIDITYDITKNNKLR